MQDATTGPLQDNIEKLNSTLELVMDELIDLATIKVKGSFDNPFVLSFLANTCFPGSFVPQDYFTPFEFGRLRFTTTGQLAEVSPQVRKMVIGGLIICRVLCLELFVNAVKYFGNLKASANGFANLEVLAAIIYATFERQVSHLEYISDNTANVTMNEEPTCLERGIDWRDGQTSDDADGILLGCPNAARYGYDKQMMEDKMDKFLQNMSRYVRFQGENERLPLFKRKIDAANAVASKVKRIDGELYQTLVNSIKERERALKVSN